MKYLIHLLLIINFLIPVPARGLSFDPNLIIPDSDFFNSQDMSAKEVQRFLEKKGSALAHYTTTNLQGETQLASDAIWSAATSYHLNPKVLLVLLQKEQSLIENPQPTKDALEWATGYGVCDSCSKDDPGILDLKGFWTQIHKAAWRKNYYKEHPDEFRYKPLKSQTVDTTSVIPQNWATAILYNYTPHIRGNYSFWKIWQRYFAKIFPDGMVVQEKGSNDIWLISQGKKRLFKSKNIFLSRYHARSLVTVESHSLDLYERGSPISYPQYSLLRDPKKNIYLIIDDKRYHIPSMALFRKIGYNPDELIKASKKDIEGYDLAGSLSVENKNPLGELVQDNKTKSVFLVRDTVKYPLLEEVLLKTNFRHWKIKKVSPKKLNTFTDGEPVVFKDGTLVKYAYDDLIYIISDGLKRPITSLEAFSALGFDFSQVIISQGDTLDLHLEGDPVDLGIEIPDEHEPTFMVSTTH